MTIEEAHIKAILELGEYHSDEYGCRIYVHQSTWPGDDPTSHYEIMVTGDYDSDYEIGRGKSWEAAFYDAYWEAAIRINDKIRREEMWKEHAKKTVVQKKEQKKTHRERRLEKKQARIKGEKK